MIDLSPAQRQAAEKGEPVRVVDETTHEAYILVREEFFEPMAELPFLPDQEPPAGINPQLLRSMQAFWRDLPTLLPQRSRSRRFVAYHGDNRIGFGRSLTQLNQECLQRGLPRGEYYVGLLEEMEAPPWGGTPLEKSLYEFSDVPIPDDLDHG